MRCQEDSQDVLGCQARIDCLDEEVIRLLKESGCLQIDFGIESSSKRILNQVMGKGFRLERAGEVLKLCNKYCIRTLSNFIISLPTGTEEDLEKIITLAKHINSSFYRLNLAVPLPGTRLYDLVGEDTTIEDYARLNFSGHANPDRFNKSEILHIKEVYGRLNRWMLMMSLRNRLGTSCSTPVSHSPCRGRKGGLCTQYATWSGSSCGTSCVGGAGLRGSAPRESQSSGSICSRRLPTVALTSWTSAMYL